MCGEFEGSAKRNLLLDHPELHVAQFAAAIGDKRVWDVSRREGKPVEWLRIYQEGNYTNVDEVDIQAQEMILRLATRIQGIRRVTIESRPEFVTERSIEFLKGIFANTGVELEIGMGLEARDRVVRNICINKQGSNDEFVRAARLISEAGFYSLAYILLKPPFIGEAEAIDEAVETAHFAAESGFSRISFEPMSVHSYTLVDALVKANLYRPPWLWSVVEVVRRCEDIGSIFGVGGVGYYPLPTEYCRNKCSREPSCSNTLIDAIMRWNATRRLDVFEGLSCDCMEVWRNECDAALLPLRHRMQTQLDVVENMLENDNYSPSVGNTADSVRKRRLLMSYAQSGTGDAAIFRPSIMPVSDLS